MDLQNSSQPDALRFGRHVGDDDVLVLDPSQTASASANVTFFSLAQLRTRTFPPSIVKTQIREIEDPEQRALAESRYERRSVLIAEQDQERETDQEGVLARQREGILEAHQRFLTARGLTYPGVQDSSEKRIGPAAKRHRSSCTCCGIALDDFVHARCLGCGAVLCSCGACGCRAPEVQS